MKFEYTHEEHPDDSSVIDEVYYNKKDELLVVKFLTSATARIYSHVPWDVFNDFQNAPSMGGFYNRFIKEKYTSGPVSVVGLELVDLNELDDQSNDEPIDLSDQASYTASKLPKTGDKVTAGTIIGHSNTGNSRGAHIQFATKRDYEIQYRIGNHQVLFKTQAGGDIEAVERLKNTLSVVGITEFEIEWVKRYFA